MTETPAWVTEKARRIVGVGWGNQGQGIMSTMQREIAAAIRRLDEVQDA